MTGSDVRAPGGATDRRAPGRPHPVPPSRQYAVESVARCLREAAAGHGQALVLTGELGIGRTAMLDWAAGRSLRSFVIARACGYPGGPDAPGTVLTELARQLRPSRSGPPAPIRGGAGEVLDPVGRLLTLVDGQERPVLLIVDDAQWVDDHSLTVLGRLGRRLGTRRAAFLSAARSPIGSPSSRPAALRGLPGITLDRLTDHEVEEAFRRLKQTAEVPAPGHRDVVRAAAGNPLALRYFARSDSLSNNADSDLVPGLSTLFGTELDELSRPALGALEEIAVWLDGWDGAGPLPAWSAPTARAELEAAGLLLHRQGRWCLGHPLLAPAARSRVSPDRLRVLHTRAAEALLADPDPTAVARHLRHRIAAADGSDNRLAAELENAARDPVLELADAGRLLVSAAGVSSGRSARLRRLMSGLDRLQVAGCLSEAGRCLSEAAVLVRTVPERAALEDLRVRGEAMAGRPSAARDTLLRLAGETATSDASGAAERYARSALISAEIGEPELARVAIDAAGRLAGSSAGPVITAATRLIDELSGAGSLPDPSSRPAVNQSDLPGCAAVPTGWALALAGRLTEALVLTEAAADTSRRFGKHGLLPVQLTALSGLRLSSGRVAGALSAAEEAVQLARSTGATAVEPRALLALARAEGVAGRTRECRAHVADAMTWCRAAQDTSLLVQASGVLGFLALSLGVHDEAVTLLEANPQIRLVEDAVLPWSGDLIEALIRSGDRTHAADLLGDLLNCGPAPAAVRCAISRGLGLLAEDPDEAVAHLSEGVRLARETGLRIEEARCVTLLGEVLGLRGAPGARRSILAGAALFDRLGAMHWRALARRLLREPPGDASARILTPAAADHANGSGDDPDLAVLTAQEWSVARLAADGLTNRQAATALFLSVRTVEFHLSNAYRKLQVSRRAQLVRLVTAARRGGGLASGATPGTRTVGRQG